MLKKLTSEQTQKLQAILLSAFSTRHELKRMVRIGLRHKNWQIISNSSDLATDICNLIQWAEKSGKIVQLLKAASREELGGNPHDLQLKQFVQELIQAESLIPEIFEQIPENSNLDRQIPLRSERGFDYTHLRDLLAAHKWKEADRETTHKMLEVMGQSKNSYLKTEHINNFPWQDLRIIDRLWVNYSNGHFGFSVQARIYQQLGGDNRYNDRIWSEFGDRIGWREENKWNDEQKLIDKAEKWSKETWETSMINHHIITGMMPIGKRGILRIPGLWEWEDKYLPDLSLICCLAERLAVFL